MKAGFTAETSVALRDIYQSRGERSLLPSFLLLVSFQYLSWHKLKCKLLARDTEDIAESEPCSTEQIRELSAMDLGGNQPRIGTANHGIKKSWTYAELTDKLVQ